jgi:general stress protein YciG
MAKKIDPSKAGKKGGRARAKSLSAEERSEIARKGAAARWSGSGMENDAMPRALCGGKEPLRIGDIEIPCYVLEDGAVPADEDRRVIRIDGMQAAIGMSPGGGTTRLVDFANRIASNSAMRNDLTVRLSSPIEFVPPNGGVAKGYSAMLLQALCDAILEARKRGILTKRYEHIAHAAEALMRGFAVTGLIALIDEATGFQYVRRRLALAELLDKYLDDHLNLWTKTFPDEFYTHFFRLKGWNYDNLQAGDVKPREVAVFTKHEVYGRLHPGIIHELETCNPYVVPGRRMHKHHQWLTREIGHATLSNHIGQIMVVMRLSNDWLDFENKLQRALPKLSDTGFLPFIDDE